MEENPLGCFTIYVEDWFHILDTPTAPKIAEWGGLEGRIERNVEALLSLLDRRGVKATMFWLGWAAERHKQLLRRCESAGHEIASHGYGHVLAYKVGRVQFRDDIRRGKCVLENIIGTRVRGFRAAGFSTTNDTQWTFEEVRSAGYEYDSSVFPSNRGHGGMRGGRLEPHLVHTADGDLIEIPQTLVSSLGKRFSVFGGGYLRLAPMGVIRWAVRRVARERRPIIAYVHPREIDPNQPRLNLSLRRRFKTYDNLSSTLSKLEDLCTQCKFIRMDELAATWSLGAADCTSLKPDDCE